MSSKWKRAFKDYSLTDHREPKHSSQVTQIQYAHAKSAGRDERPNVENWKTDTLKQKCQFLYRTLSPEAYTVQARIYLAELRARGIKWSPTDNSFLR